jgi:alpha-tubulin suppressor-like RCC1 family protein
VVQIDAGHEFTCALHRNGTVSCWGELFGTPLQRFPEEIVGLSHVVPIAAGGRHACALHRDASVSCWGWVDGLPHHERSPFEIRRVPDINNARRVVTGREHTCVLLADGGVSCFGGNAERQVTGVEGEPRLPPTRLAGIVGAVELVAGDQHNCALTVDEWEDYRLVCWGRAGHGQLGTKELRGFAEFASSKAASVLGLCSQTTCYRRLQEKDDASGVDAVECRGIAETLIHQPSRENRSPLAKYFDARIIANSSEVVQLEGGVYHMCAVRDDGSLVCWSDRNEYGELGTGSQTILDDGELSDQPLPVNVGFDVSMLTEVAEVTAGLDHSCARRCSGEVFCWGSNHKGQAGQGAYGVAVDLLRPNEAPRSLALDRHRICVVGTTGSVECWTPSTRFAAEDVVPENIEEYALSVGVQGGDECVLNRDAMVLCRSQDWRADENEALRGAVQVKVGEQRGYCVRMANGRVACRQGASAELVWVEGIPAAKELGVGLDVYCILGEDGSVWCWDQGRVRAGKGISVQRLGMIDDAVLLAMGYGDACVGHASGEVSCIRNASALLGSEVQKVEGLQGSVELGVGYDFVCGRRGDGSINCVGSYRSFTHGHDVPLTIRGTQGIRIPKVSGATRLWVGFETSCAQTVEGLWCWGGLLHDEPKHGLPQTVLTPQAVRWRAAP